MRDARAGAKGAKLKPRLLYPPIICSIIYHSNQYHFSGCADSDEEDDNFVSEKTSGGGVMMRRDILKASVPQQGRIIFHLSFLIDLYFTIVHKLSRLPQEA